MYGIMKILHLRNSDKVNTCCWLVNTRYGKVERIYKNKRQKVLPSGDSVGKMMQELLNKFWNIRYAFKPLF